MIDKLSNSVLARVDKCYQDYGCRARELKKEGRRLIGYLCAFVPLEIISAAGFIPFRIRGNVGEPIRKADAHMETIVCPLVRSCYDMCLKGKYDFLEGLVIPHSCDSMCRTYDIWRDTLGLPYNHLINVPHEVSDSSRRFFMDILQTFRHSLCRYGGCEIKDDTLTNTINIYNRVRSSVKDLYQLRKTDPPQISGSEILRILAAGSSLPVEEFDVLLGEVIEEVKTRETVGSDKRPRVMVVGAQIDNSDFIELVEECGAVVVADDLCPGTREFFPQVSTDVEPMQGLAERYLVKINCARTYREKRGSYDEYLQERFGHIGKFIEEFNVSAVILFFYKYCDPYGFEVPQMKTYIESTGTPVLYLEDTYSISNSGRLKTQIQAFLEIIA